MRMYDEIRLSPLKFPRERAVSPLLAELMSRMLAKDPVQRLTLPQIMSHPWVTHSGKAPMACLQVSSSFESPQSISSPCCNCFPSAVACYKGLCQGGTTAMSTGLIGVQQMCACCYVRYSVAMYIASATVHLCVWRSAIALSLQVVDVMSILCGCLVMR